MNKKKLKKMEKLRGKIAIQALNAIINNIMNEEQIKIFNAELDNIMISKMKDAELKELTRFLT